ncbi:hypothetical protein ABFS82_08G148200 [Erythranthe guttata]
MKHKFLKYFFLVIFSTTFFDVSHAKSISETLNFNQALNATHQWRSPAQFVNPTPQFLLAGALSFIAAAISSAGGLGGGGLFVPILTI